MVGTLYLRQFHRVSLPMAEFVCGAKVRRRFLLGTLARDRIRFASMERDGGFSRGSGLIDDVFIGLTLLFVWAFRSCVAAAGIQGRSGASVSSGISHLPPGLHFLRLLSGFGTVVTERPDFGK